MADRYEVGIPYVVGAAYVRTSGDSAEVFRAPYDNGVVLPIGPYVGQDGSYCAATIPPLPEGASDEITLVIRYERQAIG